MRSCLTGARYCASGLATAAIWTLWLLLAIVLALQVYVASVKELQVPGFLLRAIEDDLAQSGIAVKFGRAIFDPSGRVLIEKAKFTLGSFSEPIVTADAIYMRLDPWALFEHRFEPREIRATGANLFIPAMLSASGRAERMIQDLDAGFSITSRGDEFSVDYLNCRLGGVSVSAHGTVNAGKVAHGAPPATSLPLAAFVANNYVALSREFSKAEEQLSGLNQGTVTAVLTPSDTRGAVVTVELGAASLTMDSPVGFEAEDVRFETKCPLLGSAPLMTSMTASAEALKVAGKAEATSVRAHARGILRVDTLSFSPRQFDVAAGSLSGGGVSLVAPIARLYPGDGKKVAADVFALVQGSPLSVEAQVDLPGKSADLAFDGWIAPGDLEIASARIGTDVRRFVDLTEPVSASGRLKLSAGWKFASVDAHVDGRNFTAYHVRFDEARGDVYVDGDRLSATHTVGRSGDNFAHGSYEQNFRTRAYRYLMAGRLRPLDISAWFVGDWWVGIFKPFGFEASPAEATVDVQGKYVKYRLFSVFGYAEAAKPSLLRVPVDAARALLFVNQDGCEGLEFKVTKDSGDLQGSFSLVTEPVNGKWSGLDIDVTSTIDPAPMAALLPATGGAAIKAFSFGQHPSIYARGHFDGPAATAPGHQNLHLEVKAPNDLRIHGVAFDKASFKVDVKDSDVSVSDIDAGFAGGSLSGSALMSGTGADTRLKFKATLDGASLGKAAQAAAGYVLKPKTGGSTALETFARDKSGVRLDLNVSAEGDPSDLPSFVGEGNFQIQGANLGEVPLLGGLSNFLKLTELRFTQARAEFKVAKAAVTFPDLSVIGANSAIKAKGSYQIDKRQLDFTATVYPFQESRSLLQIFNAISAPISAVFRVKLSGSIDKPSWNLAYSPLNLLRPGDTKAGAETGPSPLADPGP